MSSQSGAVAVAQLWRTTKRSEGGREFQLALLEGGLEVSTRGVVERCMEGRDFSASDDDDE